jgi:energy-coupling factor transport system substrate-specific component
MHSKLQANNIGLRSSLILLLTTAIGLTAFCWPLLLSADSQLSKTTAPILTALIIPLALLVVFTDLADGMLNSKAVALLGLMASLIAAARLFGTHSFGVEPMWALIIISGRAIGPSFGFSVGSLGMASSALITGGIGPWLPFQMLAAGWIGLLSGLIPFPKGKAEVPLLALFGAFSGIFVGLLLNMWFWPTAIGSDTAISFEQGAPFIQNISRLLAFTMATSLAFDLPRAIITAVIISTVGAGMLRALRRAARTAIFVTEVQWQTQTSAKSLS